MKNTVRENESGQEIDFRNIMGLRGSVYGILSRSYSEEIDKAYLENIRSFLPILEDLSKHTEDEHFVKGVKGLASFMENITNEDELIEEYAKRFASLFLNVTRSDSTKNVHPFESVYLSPAKLVMQEQRDEVMEFYAQYGLGVDASFKEPEDHIAAELSFLGLLNEQALNILIEADMKAASEKLEGQKQFMEQHLLKWVHLMCADLKKVDDGGFYGVLADVTMGFIRIDYKFLKDLTEFIKEND
jgi:TorA maturation chaperone TorD